MFFKGRFPHLLCGLIICSVTSTFGQTISVESSKGLISACVDTYAQFPYLQVFSISGDGLISGISLNASSGFQLSTQKDSDFSTSLLLDHVSGSVQPTLVYIRSTPHQVAGSLEGTVEILTNGASPKVVQISASIQTKPILTQISNIEVESGSTVNQINFISQKGTSTYSWENDLPEIGLLESGQGPIPSFVAYNQDTEPKVARIKYRATSSSFAYIPTSGNAIAVVDPTTKSIVKLIPVGFNPYGVVVSQDGKRVYVTNNGSNNVSVIDTDLNTVIATIPVGTGPTGIVTDPTDAFVYVANWNSSSISIINTNSNSVDFTVPVSSMPYSLTVNAEGSRLFVATAYGISFVDLVSKNEISQIAIGSIFYTPGAIALSPDGLKLFVVQSGLFDNSVAVVDVVTMTVISSITVGNNPYGITFHPNGKIIYVSNSDDHTVSVIEYESLAVIRTIPVGSFPKGMSISHDGTILFVVENFSSDVALIDTFNDNVFDRIDGASFNLGLGNFISAGLGCYSDEYEFSITVLPREEEPNPVLVVGEVIGNIKSCIGLPAQEPYIGYFSIEGTDLLSPILIEASEYFEISVNENHGFSKILELEPLDGTLLSETIFIRSTSTTPAGLIVGEIKIEAQGVNISPLPIEAEVASKPMVEPMDNLLYGNQVVSPLIYFNGTGDAYHWTNDNESIGLEADGSDPIFGFTTINNGDAPIIANIQVTPVNILDNLECFGEPISFTITVTPVTLNGGNQRGWIESCLGQSSTFPKLQSIVLNGYKLESHISVTASDFFEVSLNRDSGFSNSLQIEPALGVIDSVVFFIRASDNSPLGKNDGVISVESLNATSLFFEVESEIYDLPKVLNLSDLHYVSGSQTEPINFMGSGGTMDFEWTNSDPSIGLAESGQGFIPTYTLINSSTEKREVSITVTPKSVTNLYLRSSEGGFSIFNSHLNIVVDTILEGHHPFYSAFNHARDRLYVPVFTSGDVHVLEASSNRVLRVFPTSGYPDKVLLSSNDSTLYISNIEGIELYNAFSGEFINRISIPRPDDFAIDEVKGLLFAAFNSSVSTYIVVYDLHSLQLIKHIPIGKRSQNGFRIYTNSVTNYLYVLAAYETPDDFVYRVQDRITVINKDNLSLAGIIPVGVVFQYNLKSTPNGRYIFTMSRSSTMYADKGIHAIDVIKGEIVGGARFREVQSTDFLVDNANLYAIYSNQLNTFDFLTESLVSTFEVEYINSFSNRERNFLSYATGCAGKPQEFTIHVYPEDYPLPSIQVDPSISPIQSCGSSVADDASMQNFTVMAYNLHAPLHISIPQYFEMSLDQVLWHSSELILTPIDGEIDQKVYVRNSANSLKGKITGEVLFSSNGANNLIRYVESYIADMPEFVGMTLPDGRFGEYYSYSVALDNSGFSYSAIGLPEGLIISNDGIISGIPQSSNPDPIRFLVTLQIGQCQVTSEFTITILKKSAMIYVDGLDHVYDGNEKHLTFETIPSGLNVSITYNGTNQQPVNAGTYNVVVDIVDPNYSGKFSGSLVISKAQLQVVAKNYQRDYGAVNPFFEVTYDGWVNGEDNSILDEIPSAICYATELSDVGQYPITLTGGIDNNYELILNHGILTITKINQTIDFPVIADRPSNSPPFYPQALASSGLSIRFEIVSGPAIIIDSLIGLTGNGLVTVAAIQAGNQNYFSAYKERSFMSTLVVSVENEVMNDLVTIFPNPAKSTLHFKVSDEISSFHVHMINSKGQVVFSGNLSSSVASIGLSDYTSGLYLLHISIAGKYKTFKLLIE